MKVDVLVIGGGAAGCMAALQAHRLGAKVLMVVKGKMGRSGATPLASGVRLGPLTGIPPRLLSPLKRIYARVSDYVRLPLPKPFSGSLAGAVSTHFGLVDQEYFLDFGVWMQTFLPFVEESGLYLRRDDQGSLVAVAETGMFHSHGMTGYQFGESRRKDVLRAGIDVIEEATAFTLTSASEGNVGGAMVLDYRSGRLLAVGAGATIMATGHTDWLSTRATGTREMAANGLAMAVRAGAELHNVEIQWFHASDAAAPRSWMRLHHYPNPLHGSDRRVVMRNAKGDVYLDTADTKVAMPYTIQMKELYKQVGKGNADWDHGSFADFSGVEANALREYQYHWEFYRHAGKDMSRDLLECGITWHMCAGGIRADTKTMQTRVPGLFIAGGVGGHMLGSIILATFDGETAANYAVEYARRVVRRQVDAKDVELAERKLNTLSEVGTAQNVSPIAVKEQVRAVAWKHMMYRKSERSLHDAISELSRIRTDVVPHMRLRSACQSFNWDLVDALDVEDMIDVLEISAQASLARTESRGPHFREDYPFTDNKNWLKHVVVSREHSKIKTRIADINQKYIKLKRGRVDYLADPLA